MVIGLISDTHGYLDPAVLRHFEKVDEIWHAGDIGSAEVADVLESIKPLRAVYGNIDDREMQVRFPEHLRFECSGVQVWLTHIAGTPPRYTKHLRAGLERAPAGLLVCGHSHILKVMPDPQRSGMLYINPGAAGRQGFHHMRTILILKLEAGRVIDLAAVELGPRGS